MSWWTKANWSRADKIGAAGLAVAALAAAIAILALPGAPKLLHADEAPQSLQSELNELKDLQGRVPSYVADIERRQQAVRLGQEALSQNPSDKARKQLENEEQILEDRNEGLRFIQDRIEVLRKRIAEVN